LVTTLVLERAQVHSAWQRDCPLSVTAATRSRGRWWDTGIGNPLDALERCSRSSHVDGQHHPGFAAPGLACHRQAAVESSPRSDGAGVESEVGVQHGSGSVCPLSPAVPAAEAFAFSAHEGVAS